MTEQRYLDLLLNPLDESANYKPKFGTDEEGGVSLEQFERMYGEDPFYHWIGLDSKLMYAAHKAAGGMTSIYRQIGNGCDALFRAVIQDTLALSNEQVVWTYEVEKKDKTRATLTLDARIDVSHLHHKPEVRARVVEWLDRCGRAISLPEARVRQLKGAVFEARQGYKSADAKRQNADLGFAMNAAAENYLPVFAVISTQVSQSVVRRYRNKKMLVLTGTRATDDVSSTYAFFRNVVGFELDSFFERNSSAMRLRCQRVLRALLSPS
jgi:hypothetical protein